MHTSGRIAALLAAALLASSCGADDPAPTSDPAPIGTATDTAESSTESTDEQRFPDVIDARLEPTGDTWRLHATISSPYDAPDRYADAFRALTEEGTVLGVRELLHDHADEQPFTRTLEDLVIPDGIARITLEGRDLANG